MTRLEKSAWFDLAVVALTVVAYVVLFILLGSGPAFAAIAFMALLSLQQPYRRSGKGKPQAVLDERDQSILERSCLVGYSVFWVAFVVGTMGLWALNQSRGSIPVDALPLFPVAGCLVLTVGRSVATLALYARGR